nr:unnamed protein product [Callosobruchus analis]
MEPDRPLPSQETARWRHQHASQVNANIKKIVEWGLLLGININNNMSWHDHVIAIAKTASQKLGDCPVAEIRPSLEYYSHVWGCAPKHSSKFMNSRREQLDDAPNLKNDLHSLEHPRRVADMSLFYRFYHGRCSSNLSQIIAPRDKHDDSEIDNTGNEDSDDSADVQEHISKFRKQINKGRWSKEETIVHKYRAWNQASHYHQHASQVNADIKKIVEWGLDARLKQLVETLGERWDLISNQFPDRSDVQCQQRWTKVVNPELVKGPWTKEFIQTPPLFLIALIPKTLLHLIKHNTDNKTNYNSGLMRLEIESCRVATFPWKV